MRQFVVILILSLWVVLQGFRLGLPHSIRRVATRVSYYKAPQYWERLKRYYPPDHIKPNTTLPTLGSPVIYLNDANHNVVYIKLIVPKEETQRAFNQACDYFKQELGKLVHKPKGFGFVQQNNLTNTEVTRRVGNEKVMQLSSQLMSKSVKEESLVTGLPLLGLGKLVNFDVKKFIPGAPVEVLAEFCLMPPIEYSADYKSLNITLYNDPEEFEKKVLKYKTKILSKYRELSPAPSLDYRAQKEDSLTVNIRGYFLNEDNTRGESVYDPNTGNGVELWLNPFRCIPEIAEYMCGCKVGDKATVPVRFSATAGPVFGRRASFDIEVLGIQVAKMPEWNDALANTEKEGQTIAELDEFIANEIKYEDGKRIAKRSIEQIDAALAKIATVHHIPRTMKMDYIRKKYNQVIDVQRRAGTNESELLAMMTEDKFEAYSKRYFDKVDSEIKPILIIRDIAERENIKVDPVAVEQSVNLVIEKMQGAEVKNSQGEIEPVALNDEIIRYNIEEHYVKAAVYEMLANSANVTYKDKFIKN